MMFIRPKMIGALALAMVFAAALTVPVAADTPAPKTREFNFTYGATVTGLKPDQKARIWLPVPPSNDDQTVTITKQEPADAKTGKEAKYGNTILYVEAKANKDGNIPVSVTYNVKRKEVKADLKAKSMDKEDTALFLKADAKVPIDGKPLTLLKGKELPKDSVEKAKQLYEIVNKHMKYSKEGTGWGQGDSVWACDSKFGNCSDFHSLFISLARSQKLPAKFEMGFPLPEKHGKGDIAGYHCWAKFKPEGMGWIPVDISEANKNEKMKDYYFGNLTEDRVAFSVGRDLTLVPKQDGPALNFMIYPYVEVDGKPYAADKIQKKFSYEDVEKK